MEISFEEAQNMILARLQENPDMAAVAHGPFFKKTLAEILDFEDVPEWIAPIIENEVLVVLAQYAPLRELGKNISESTGLDDEKAGNLATLITTILLSPISEKLRAFETLWYEQLALVTQTPIADPTLKEGLQLRPEEGDIIPRGEMASDDDTEEESARPLTRDELLSALSAKRTMASDIKAVQSTEGTPSGPVQGYEAYRARIDTERT
jgi:hypothetical protein